MLSPSQLKHFYNRAAFGTPNPPTPEKVVASILKQSSANKPIHILKKPERDYESMRPSEAEIKEAFKKNKEDQLTLNAAWFSQLTDPSVVLREKMTFFWHDHFACRTRNAFLAQQQINTLRTHAFGKFGDLLMAVSKDPGMLQFLNNQQNKKDSPNENFAREVMELFTMGHGNYTEEDIKNAARAFTGWAFNPVTGEFQFRQRQHDFESKTFRGKTGNFSGEDIITMILEEKQTAVFITKKICQFFVGTEIPNATLQELSEQFYHSDYDILQLVTTIYSDAWFYDDAFRGNRIKSPVELIAGIRVHTGGNFQNPLNVIFLQKALGQILLQPPNVGGWPTGKEWIDSSSLTFRMSLPSLLLRNTENQFMAKDDGDANDVTNTIAKAGKISFSADWNTLTKVFIKNSSSDTLAAVEDHLLAIPTTAANRKMISVFAGSSSDDLEFLKKVFIGYMSLPEYQLS